MQKFGRILFLSSVVFFFCALIGCGLKKSETKVNGGTDGDRDGKTNGHDKLTYDTPPLFTLSQLKVGQWIEWQRTKGNEKECVRWEIKRFAEGADIQIQGRFSKTCPVPDTALQKIETILVDPNNGRVHSDLIRNEGTSDSYHGTLHDDFIHQFIYMNSDKVNFSKGTWQPEKIKFPAYQVEGRVYYNLPENPLHAFGVNFKDKTDSRFVYFDSEPKLTPLPEKP